MREGIRWGAALCVAALLQGCDFTSFAASSTIRVIVRAAPAVQRFADLEMAEAAIPSSIATMEGLMLVQTDNDALHETLARSYASYGFGFLEEHLEEAQARDDEARAEHFAARASAAYLRSRQVAFEMLSIWEPDGGGAEGHVRAGLEAWRTYLARFTTADRVGSMFWGAYAWARYINLHRDDVNAIADLPFVNALAERVRAIDHTYYQYAPHALVGGLIGSAPAQLGGRPDLARQEFDAAILATHRRNLMYLTLEARIVAVALQDRPLYRRLLQEVIDAGDIDPDQRLANLIAKRRAQRYLAQIDELFVAEN